MKQKINLVFLLSFTAGIYLFLFSAGCTTGKQAGKTASAAEITTAINSNNWVFTANTVLPQAGRSRPVNGVYDVQFTKDTAVVYLPYFGRAYSISGVISGKGPLDFITASFSFNKEQNNKGGWDITVKPKDNNEIQSLSFTLYDNGTAQLNVLLTNRSPISFNGIVSPKK